MSQQNITNFRLELPELEEAFNYLGAHVKDRTKTIAKDLIVNGLRVVDVAKKYKLGRRRVYDIRSMMMNAYMLSIGYPADWEMVTLIASPKLAAEFVERAQREHRAWLATQHGKPG